MTPADQLRLLVRRPVLARRSASNIVSQAGKSDGVQPHVPPDIKLSQVFFSWSQ